MATSTANRITEQNRKWYTLAASCFGLFMVIMDLLVLQVALPTLAQDLNASTTQLQWVVTSYLLLFAAFQITGGGLGDRFGRKRWFSIGLVVFTGSSLLAAFSQNVETLIAARTLQGVGGALIMPLSLSLISAAFPPEERGKAVGLWSAISVSGFAFGPIVGGALVEYASWEWIFLMNLPIGVGALLVTSAAVRESRDESGAVASDLPGTGLVTAAIASLTWGLIEAGDRGWGDRWILSAFGAAAILGALFVWVEARTARPMVPLRFFRSGTFSAANIGGFMIAAMVVGVTFSITLYLQNVHGYSAIKTGLSLLPWVIPMMLLFPVSGALTPRIGPRRLVAAGTLIAGLGTLLLLQSGAGANYLAIVPAFVVMGVGMSLFWAPMMAALLNSVETDKAGIASAVNGAVREVGAAFGIAFLGTTINRVYQSEFRTADEIEAIRGDAALAPLQPVVDTVGSGAAFAGRIVVDPALFPSLDRFAPLVAQIREASAQAFVAGMDRAMLVLALGMLLCSAVSYLLIKDPVPQTASALAEEPDVVPAAAD